MKIHPVYTAVGQYTKLQAYKARTTPIAMQGADALELSDQAKLFTEALNAAKRNMEMNEANKSAKIDELKQMIQDGVYEVSDDALVEKILLG